MEHLFFHLFMLCLLFTSLCAFGVRAAQVPQFEAIYQFGDSLSDIGNVIREPSEVNSPFKSLPYGLSYHPTGRASDGLLIIDYIAMHFHLPLLNPYLAKGSDFSHGVNFAVAGATVNGGENSLARQLEWFKTHLNSTFSRNSRAIRDKLQKSLVFMGEIGGNDFNGPFNQNKPINEVYMLIPGVIKTISNVVEEVIRLGANNIVVPGNFPIGCVPNYLSKYETKDKSKYDELQCLKDFNNLIKSYNYQLEQAIQQLQQKHPDVTIVYADYYSALIEVITHASHLGFEQGGWNKACCGSGNNPYNFGAKFCVAGAPVCQYPSKRLNWDGIHMTQQGNKCVADLLLKQIVPSLLRHHATPSP